MNFFNIGAGEFLLIIVLLMLVVGPQRLPHLFRQVGKGIRDLRKFASEIDPELLQDFREISRDFQTVRDEMQTLRTDMAGIQRDLAGAAKDVTDSLNEVVGRGQRSTSLTPAAMHCRFGGRHHPAAQPAARPATVGAAAAVASGYGADSGSALRRHLPPPVQRLAAAALDLIAYDEIVGTPLRLREPGDGAYLDEILGVKVYPVPRSAARAAAEAGSGNGHDASVRQRERHAVMASLSQRQPQARPAAPTRATAHVKRPRLSRERTTRRG